MKNILKFNTGFVLKRILLLVVLVVLLVAVYSAVKKTDVTPSNSAPTITLVSPNGGETLTTGQPTTVTFTTSGEIKDGYKVVIWLDDAAAPLATIDATTTSHTFTLPESILIGGDAVAPLEPGSYKIRVALYDGTPCTGFCMPTDVKELASDSSDGMVMIAKNTTSSSVQYVNDGTMTPEIISIEPSYTEDIHPTVTIKGKYLNGFEGETQVVFVQTTKTLASYGQKGIIVANSYVPAGATTLTFTIPTEICTQYMGASGNPCPSKMIMGPGSYEVYVQPWSKPSNKVKFIMNNM